MRRKLLIYHPIASGEDKLLWKGADRDYEDMVKITGGFWIFNSSVSLTGPVWILLDVFAYVQLLNQWAYTFSSSSFPSVF